VELRRDGSTIFTGRETRATRNTLTRSREEVIRWGLDFAIFAASYEPPSGSGASRFAAWVGWPEQAQALPSFLAGQLTGARCYGREL